MNSNTSVPQAAETPWEDLRQTALRHYEELSTAANHWYSAIPAAINYYFDHARPPVPDSERIAEMSPLGKERRPVSRLADRIIDAVYRCIHEMEDDETDGRKNPIWWLDNLKAKAVVIRLLETSSIASTAPDSERIAEELLPCPFCRGIDLLLTDQLSEDGEWNVFCHDCGGGSGWKRERKNAVMAWNTRSIASTADTRVAEAWGAAIAIAKQESPQWCQHGGDIIVALEAAKSQAIGEGNDAENE